MTTTYQVGLEFKGTARSESSLRRLEQRLAGIEAKIKEQRRGKPAFKPLGDSADGARRSTEKLGNSIKRFRSELNGAQTNVGGLTGALEGLQRTRLGGLVNDLKQITALGPRAAAAFGGVAAAIGTVAVTVQQLGAAYRDAGVEAESFRKVATLADSPERLRAAVRDVVGETGSLATTAEALEASYQILSAGIEEGAASSKVLASSLQLAAGGFTTAETAADAITTILNSYNKAASETAKVTDQILQTQNDGKIVVEQYAQGIGRVASVAAQAGVGIEELNAALAASTASGLRPESAFAGLRGAIVKLSAPSRQGKKVLEELGIEYGKAAIEAKGFGGILDEVFTKTAGNQELLRLVFEDIEALSAISAVAGDDLQKYNNALERQETVTGLAADAAKTAASPVKRLQTGFKNLRAAVGQPLRDAVNSTARAIILLADGMQTLIDKLPPAQQGLFNLSDAFYSLIQSAVQLTGPLNAVLSKLGQIYALYELVKNASSGAAARANAVVGEAGPQLTPGITKRLSKPGAQEKEPNVIFEGVENKEKLEAEKRAAELVKKLSGEGQQEASNNIRELSQERIRAGKNVALEEAQNQQRLVQAQFSYDKQVSDAKLQLKQKEFDVEVKNIRTSAALEDRLTRSRQQATAGGFTGVARQTYTAFTASQNRRTSRDRELQQVRQKVERLELQVKATEAQLTMAQSAPVRAQLSGTGGGGGGVYVEGSKGPTSTGPHFDIKRTDRGYFDRAALDQYVRVNGGPLSAGYTAPGPRGGWFGAGRNYGEHRGWDYAFGGGAQLSLQGGAQFGNSRPTANGDATIFTTPDGSQYQILHGTFKPGAGAGGVMANTELGEITKAGGIAGIQSKLQGMNLELDAARSQYEALTAAQDEFTANDKLTFVNDITDAFRSQAESLQISNDVLEGSNKLISRRASPEALKAEQERIALTDAYTKKMALLDTLLAENPELTDRITEAQDKLTNAYNDTLAVIGRQEELEGFNRKLQESAAIAESIEGALADGIGNAIQGLIDGTKDLNDVLKETLASIGQILIQASVSRLVSGIIPGGLFTGLTGRASGGNVTSGQPYLVGENGPELFSPGQSGTISNSRAFGELRSTLDTFGQGAPDMSDDMGEPGPVQVEYSGAVLNFNGSEYVSKEDVPRIVDQAVKQSYGYTQNRLRSRPTDRRKLGMR